MEYLITNAQHAYMERIILYGIKINANRGPIVPPASISLPMAQTALTVYVVAVGPGNILH